MKKCLKQKFESAKQFVKKNKHRIIIGAVSLAGASAVVWFSLKALENIEISPDEVQFCDENRGWIFLDPYAGYYWPVKHGLSKDEIDAVLLLMNKEDICAGQALAELGLLRANC